MNRFHKITVIFSAFLWLPAAHADTNALEVVTQQQILVSGYGTEEAEVTLTHQTVAQTATTMTFDFKILEGFANRGEASLIKFKKPDTIKDFALLSQMNPNRDGESSQYIYLPSLDSVKMVTGASRSDSFMGSAFNFEDFLPIRLSDYDFSYLRDEPCGSSSCALIEAKPHSAESPYAKKTIWFDVATRQINRVEFYDKSGKTMKQCDFIDYELFQNRFLRPRKIVMTVAETRERSTLEFTHRRFGTSMSADDFSPRAMKK